MDHGFVATPDQHSTPAPRHPWLAKASWFVEASDRLIGAMAPGSTIVIGIDSQRDRDPTFGVNVDSIHTQDELDDMPGLRRIERRSGELAAHLPVTPPFGARIVITPQDLAVHLRWHHLGQAVLMSRRHEGVWQAVDMIMMPDRHLRLRDEDLRPDNPLILPYLDRLLGGGRIAAGTRIHSALRRDTEIRVVLDPGGILKPGSSEVA
jgi:hypothetical protein